jgi:hypothetical protein
MWKRPTTVSEIIQTCLVSDGMVLFDFLCAMAVMIVIRTSLMHSSEKEEQQEKSKEEARRSTFSDVVNISDYASLKLLVI